MIAILSGTNRPGAKTRQVAGLLEQYLNDHGTETALLDLHELPLSLLDPSSYEHKPAELAVFQETILAADGLLVVTPEYNGSFPGVLKLFIDMLRFPESLVGKPTAFVGLSAGRWGGMRAVEQLQTIFQYRCAHLFGRRVFIPGIASVCDDDGRLIDDELQTRLRAFAVAFSDFVGALRG